MMKTKRIIACIISCILFMMCIPSNIICFAYGATCGYFRITPKEGEVGQTIALPLTYSSGGSSWRDIDIEITCDFSVTNITISNDYKDRLFVVGNHILYNDNDINYVFDGHIADIHITIPYGTTNKQHKVYAKISGGYRTTDSAGSYSTSDSVESYVYVVGDTADPIVFTDSKRLSATANEGVVSVEGYKSGKVLINFQNFRNDFRFCFDTSKYKLVNHPQYTQYWSESYSGATKIIEYKSYNNYESCTFELFYLGDGTAYFNVDWIQSGTVSYKYNYQMGEENKSLKEQLGYANQEITELKNRINLLSTGVYGDVNGDEVVDVQDAQIILAYYTERDVAKKSVPDLVTFGLNFGKYQ